LNFETGQLIENLEALIKKLITHKKFDPQNFILDCVLYAAPSTEKFKVDISRFIEIEQDEDEKFKEKLKPNDS
jgi:hypothetical protein